MNYTLIFQADHGRASSVDTTGGQQKATLDTTKAEALMSW